MRDTQRKSIQEQSMLSVIEYDSPFERGSKYNKVQIVALIRTENYSNKSHNRAWNENDSV